MRETLDLLVDEHLVRDLFSPDELQGRRFGVSLRSVSLAARDGRLKEIGRRDSEQRAKGNPVVLAWNIRREYTRLELDRAELFHLNITRQVMDSGEAHGTIYDRSQTCPVCGAGERQVSDLFLDLRKAPKSADIALTLCHEWIVSQRLAEILIDADLSGFDLQLVHQSIRHDEGSIDLHKYASGRELLRLAEEAGCPHPGAAFWAWLNRPEQAELVERVTDEHVRGAKTKGVKRLGKPQPTWYQLLITSRPLTVDSRTVFGINPFNDDPEGEYRCPLGHARGLNLISEPYVTRDSWDGSDFAVSSDWVGAPATPLVPRARYRRLLFISPRVWRLLREHKIKGWKVEIARLV